MHATSTRSLRSNRYLLAALAVGLSATLAAPAWGQLIHQDRQLLASDGAMGEAFGIHIAIDSGVIGVGAYQDDDNGIDSGSAYLFDASTGAQLAKLLPDDGAADDRFGFSIAIDSGIVAVGAMWDDDNGSRSGSAYLFDAATGAQLFKLLPIGGEASGRFGWSIAIADGIVAVGADGNSDNGGQAGSAYLFDASTGEQLAELLTGDGANDDHFGISIAIANGIVAVGASGEDDNGTGSGSAYLFDALTGAQLAKLLPGDGADFDFFGGSIAIADGIVAVGAWGGDDNGTDSGSAYLFDASTGVQLAKLLPGDGAGFDHFGNSIAIGNGVVAVGANRDKDNGHDSGSAYRFDVSTGMQIDKLLPCGGAQLDSFGHSVGIDNGVTAVGAPFSNDIGGTTGSAYVFTTAAWCVADLTGDCEANTQDFLAFLNAWANGDPIADWDGNGTINTLDFLAYLNDWSAGC